MKPEVNLYSDHEHKRSALALSTSLQPQHSDCIRAICLKARDGTGNWGKRRKENLAEYFPHHLSPEGQVIYITPYEMCAECLEKPSQHQEKGHDEDEEQAEKRAQERNSKNVLHLTIQLVSKPEMSIQQATRPDRHPFSFSRLYH